MWLDFNRRPIDVGDSVKIQGDTTAYDAVPTYVINSNGTVVGFARTKVIVHVEHHGDRPFRVPPKGLQVTEPLRAMVSASPALAPTLEPGPPDCGRRDLQLRIAAVLRDTAQTLEDADTLPRGHIDELTAVARRMADLTRMAVLA